MVDLKVYAAKAAKEDLRTKSLRQLHAEAIKPTPKPEEINEDEIVEERVVIRSLDEKVAVGGKNFSQSPVSLDQVELTKHRSRSKAASRPRSGAAEAPHLQFLDHG